MAILILSLVLYHNACLCSWSGLDWVEGNKNANNPPFLVFRGHHTRSPHSIYVHFSGVLSMEYTLVTF